MYSALLYKKDEKEVLNLIQRYIYWLCPRLAKHYTFIMIIVMTTTFSFLDASASQTPPPSTGGDDFWSRANALIIDIYNSIAAISTVLAGLMSAIAVIGAKMSNNQHKVDQAWDWLKRVWIAWAVINGIGAFIAWVKPIFDGVGGIDA